MSVLQPTDPMRDRLDRNAEQVIKDSVNLLYLHGFLSVGEVKDIDERIEKWEKDFYIKQNKGGV